MRSYPPKQNNNIIPSLTEGATSLSPLSRRRRSSHRARLIVLVIRVFLVEGILRPGPHLGRQILHNSCQHCISALLVVGIPRPYQDEVRIEPHAEGNAANIVPLFFRLAVILPLPTHTHREREGEREYTFFDNFLQDFTNSHYKNLLTKLMVLALGHPERPCAAVLVPLVLPTITDN